MDADWFPHRLSDQRGWYADFTDEAAPVGAELGLNAADALAAAAAWLAADAAVAAARMALRAALQTAKEQAPLSEKAVRAFVRQVKASPQVTPVQVARLGASPRAARPRERAAAHAPRLHLHRDAGHVVVKFRKMGHQGILLYGRRGPETEWRLLGLCTVVPYHDERPNLLPGQAETRHYRAFFADRDQPVGDPSGEALLAVE